MPIYAYRCSTCGHAKDVLQKMSDPVLTVCPECGNPTFVKQVTAAGFQLKGSGWYVTDFRGGDKPAATPAAGVVSDTAKTDSTGSGGESATATPAAPAKSESAPAPAAAPASPTAGSK